MLSQIHLRSILSRFGPSKPIQRPIFILGCGRSGTTILGRAMSHHPSITYLNEPRHLWVACYPETDIWSIRAGDRLGKLQLTHHDVREDASQKLRRLFGREARATGRPVLIEKLPINNFRLSFISAIFPDARFVHIVRNGIEVARSIEKMIPKGWFGADDYKWEQLIHYAGERPETAHLPALCRNDFERGLLEWRLSTEAVNEFLDQQDGQCFCEVSYEELVTDPNEVINRVLEFIGLPRSVAVDLFAKGEIRRRSTKSDDQIQGEDSARVGGMLLEKYNSY